MSSSWKRRFGELVGRVQRGERFVVSRRGHPAVALVPPRDELARRPRSAPRGLAAGAGALADWQELESVVEEIYAARAEALDRPATGLEWASYCFDTDVLSAVLRRNPPLRLVRGLAVVPPEEQFTTAITLGEVLLGASQRGSDRLLEAARELIGSLVGILPFDQVAAETYSPLRAGLERAGTPLGEPGFHIASIALANDLRS